MDSGASVEPMSGRSKFRRNSMIHDGGSDSFIMPIVARRWYRSRVYAYRFCHATSVIRAMEAMSGWWAAVMS